MHLEEALSELQRVENAIPVTMRIMFEQHVAKTVQNFHPGLNTLAWNSMNIGKENDSLYFYIIWY